jgi:hypothetical protein
MKLANSWSEVVPTAVPSGQLYDESEEYDEVDESKDGCGGVQWQKYVLNKGHTSDTILFELAREVRGVEQRRGKSLTVIQYRAICDKWEDVSRRCLRKGHDYFPEFLAKLDRVTMPKGETLETAFRRAQHRESPSKVLPVHNKGLRLLASLCQELQYLYGDQPIMLCQTSVAKLFDVTQQTISTWIHALKTLEVLRLAEPAIKNARAARYHFIE